MLAFKRRASALGIVTLASVSITGGANDESDFSEQTEALRASGATVIVNSRFPSRLEYLNEELGA